MPILAPLNLGTSGTSGESIIEITFRVILGGLYSIQGRVGIHSFFVECHDSIRLVAFTDMAMQLDMWETSLVVAVHVIDHFASICSGLVDF